MANASQKKVTVEQIGSPIGRPAYQRATLVGLGLNKIGRRASLEDTPGRARHDRAGGASRPRRRSQVRTGR